MRMMHVAVFLFIGSTIFSSINALADQSSDLPSIQVNNFGKILQVSGAMPALEGLLNPNPFYPDGLDYANQLLLHYKTVTETVGEITHFTKTQEKELAKHLHYLQYYSEHKHGGIIWEFEFGLREQEWFLTKIYFEKH